MSQSVDKRQLSQQAIHGTFWIYLSFVAGKSLTFVTTIILARLLVPEQFGVMGYCIIAIQYLDILSSFGMETALISRRNRFDEAANATFFVSIAINLLLFAATWAVSPAIAAFFREEAVIELIGVLALTLPINALGIVPRAIIQRNLKFKLNLWSNLSRNFVKGAVAILLAWQGFGVWSLVYGQIAGELTDVAILWSLVRWRPTFKVELSVTTEILQYGIHIVGAGIIGALLTNVDYIFVGRILGASALGYYTLAYRVPELLIRNFNTVIDKVSMPVISKFQTDIPALRSVYLRYINYLALFVFPAGLGLALIADIFIKTFYTSDWLPSIIPMQVIAVALSISAIGYVPGVLYKANNRPDILTKLAFFKLPFAVVVLWLGTQAGIIGVAIAQLALATFNLTLDSLMVTHIVKLHLGDIAKALQPALIGTLTMGGVLIIVKLLVKPEGIWGLVLMAILGALIYFVVLLIAEREMTTRISKLILTAILPPRKAKA